MSIIDNDVLAVEEDVWPCRQTSMFRFPDDSNGNAFHNEWLVDYNCKNGDAGGLPGEDLTLLAQQGTSRKI